MDFENQKGFAGSYRVSRWSAAIARMVRSPVVMAGLVPAIYAAPPQSRTDSGFSPPLVSGRSTRRTAFMAGASPAVTHVATQGFGPNGPIFW